MKKLAVIGSSGGNLYNQGGNDPAKMMREIFVQAEDGRYGNCLCAVYRNGYDDG